MVIRFALFGFALIFCPPALHADQVWDWNYEGINGLEAAHSKLNQPSLRACRGLRGI